MSLSIFAQQIESLSRDRNEFETNARLRLTDAVNSFVSATEVNPSDVSFKQNGHSKDIEELHVENNEFKFHWIIEISHGGYNLQASAPVYAVRAWGNESQIYFGVGEHTGAGALEDDEFMKKLITELQKGINQAFP